MEVRNALADAVIDRDERPFGMERKFDGGRQLSALIGRPTTPLSTAVADALAAVSKA